MLVNLPVGDNFHDHPMCAMEYHLEKPLGGGDKHKLEEGKDELEQFLYFTRGLSAIC